MCLQKILHRPGTPNQLRSEVDPRNVLFGEFLQVRSKVLGIYEHATKRTLEFVIGMNLAGRNQDQRFRWRRERTAGALQIGGTANDGAEVQFLVPVARILLRNL